MVDKITNYRIETLCLHAGQKLDPVTGARAVPIYQTTSYVFRNTEHAENLFSLKEDGYIYSRIANPTVDVVERRIAAIEGGSGALLTSSGMSAIFLVIYTLAKNGDHIISSSSLYGGTETLFRYTLPRIGISVDFIEDITAEKIEKVIRSNTKAIYIESIGNPKGDMPDFESISNLAHRYGIPVIVDNTFAPVICQPLKYGADIVIHSCTKWIGGHGTSIGGVIIDGGKFDWGSGRFQEFVEPDPSYHGVVYWEKFRNVPGEGNIAFIVKCRVQGMRNIGMCASPFNAFLFLQGLETLPLRMERHCSNAMRLAEWLKSHPKVEYVNYTGLPDHPSYAIASKYLKGGYGSVLCFSVKGGVHCSRKVIEKLKLASHLANVGDAKTLVIHPASTTHQQLSPEAQRASGVTPQLIRVSVGLENIEDIIADFDRALSEI